MKDRDIATEEDKDEEREDRVDYVRGNFEEWGNQRKEKIKFEYFWDETPDRGDEEKWKEMVNHSMVKISIARLTLKGADSLLSVCQVKDWNDVFDTVSTILAQDDLEY